MESQARLSHDRKEHKKKHKRKQKEKDRHRHPHQQHHHEGVLKKVKIDHDGSIDNNELQEPVASASTFSLPPPGKTNAAAMNHHHHPPVGDQYGNDNSKKVKGSVASASHPQPSISEKTNAAAAPALNGFSAAAKARFPELTSAQWEKLVELGALVQDWNGKVNVISRKDIENVLPSHVLPCMGISKLLTSAPPGTRLMDVGTGGGFPGLPLAICCPHVKFLLVDSIGKKIKVVGDMAAKLGLKNVTARHTRVEEVRESFDYITGRSVTAMPRFVGWVKEKFKQQQPGEEKAKGDEKGVTKKLIASGILYIKGGINEDNQEEDLGGLIPTGRYPLSELIGGGVYDGDKSVLHFSVEDLQREAKRKR